MADVCINHPDRPCAVKIHNTLDGGHSITPLCFDCACEAGDPTALTMKGQSMAMDAVLESLSPTPLASERLQ
jgi:hypothetical protein